MQQKNVERSTIHFGRGVRLCRESMGLSQSELCEQIGITAEKLRQFEAGILEMDVRALMACAEVFDMSLDDLVAVSRSDIDEVLLCIESELEDE